MTSEPKPLSQPRPQGLLLVQNGGRRNPLPRLPKWLRKFVRISSCKHDKMSSFCLNNGFRLQKTNRATRRWRQPIPRKSHFIMCHVTKYSTMRRMRSIQQPPAAFSDRQFERGEDPGDEVALEPHIQRTLLTT